MGAPVPRNTFSQFVFHGSCRKPFWLVSRSPFCFAPAAVCATPGRRSRGRLFQVDAAFRYGDLAHDQFLLLTDRPTWLCTVLVRPFVRRGMLGRKAFILTESRDATGVMGRRECVHSLAHPTDCNSPVVRVVPFTVLFFTAYMNMPLIFQ
jgi:hypothetical protein